MSHLQTDIINMNRVITTTASFPNDLCPGLLSVLCCESLENKIIADMNLE